MRRDSSLENGKFSPRQEGKKSWRAKFSTRQKRTRGANALLAREDHDKEKSVVLASELPPRVPALTFGRSLPRIGEPLSACMSSLCLTLVDEGD